MRKFMIMLCMSLLSHRYDDCFDFSIIWDGTTTVKYVTVMQCSYNIMCQKKEKKESLLYWRNNRNQCKQSHTI